MLGGSNPTSSENKLLALHMACFGATAADRQPHGCHRCGAACDPKGGTGAGGAGTAGWRCSEVGRPAVLSAKDP